MNRLRLFEIMNKRWSRYLIFPNMVLWLIIYEVTHYPGHDSSIYPVKECYAYKIIPSVFPGRCLIFHLFNVFYREISSKQPLGKQNINWFAIYMSKNISKLFYKCICLCVGHTHLHSYKLFKLNCSRETQSISTVSLNKINNTVIWTLIVLYGLKFVSWKRVGQ